MAHHQLGILHTAGCPQWPLISSIISSIFLYIIKYSALTRLLIKVMSLLKLFKKKKKLNFVLSCSANFQLNIPLLHSWHFVFQASVLISNMLSE